MKKQAAEEAHKQTIISERTLIPLSLVISIVGFTGWITYVAYSTNVNAKSIKRMGAQESEVVKELKKLNTRLSRIEGKLDGLRIKR